MNTVIIFINFYDDLTKVTDVTPISDKIFSIISEVNNISGKCMAEVIIIASENVEENKQIINQFKASLQEENEQQITQFWSFLQKNNEQKINQFKASLQEENEQQITQFGYSSQQDNEQLLKKFNTFLKSGDEQKIYQFKSSLQQKHEQQINQFIASLPEENQKKVNQFKSLLERSLTAYTSQNKITSNISVSTCKHEEFYAYGTNNSMLFPEIIKNKRQKFNSYNNNKLILHIIDPFTNYKKINGSLSPLKGYDRSYYKIQVSYNSFQVYKISINPMFSGKETDSQCRLETKEAQAHWESLSSGSDSSKQISIVRANSISSSTSASSSETLTNDRLIINSILDSDFVNQNLAGIENYLQQKRHDNNKIKDSFDEFIYFYRHQIKPFLQEGDHLNIAIIIFGVKIFLTQKKREDNCQIELYNFVANLAGGSWDTCKDSNKLHEIAGKLASNQNINFERINLGEFIFNKSLKVVFNNSILNTLFEKYINSCGYNSDPNQPRSNIWATFSLQSGERGIVKYSELVYYFLITQDKLFHIMKKSIFEHYRDYSANNPVRIKQIDIKCIHQYMIVFYLQKKNITGNFSATLRAGVLEITRQLKDYNNTIFQNIYPHIFLSIPLSNPDNYVTKIEYEKFFYSEYDKIKSNIDLYIKDNIKRLRRELNDDSINSADQSSLMDKYKNLLALEMTYIPKENSIYSFFNSEGDTNYDFYKNTLIEFKEKLRNKLEEGFIQPFIQHNTSLVA